MLTTTEEQVMTKADDPYAKIDTVEWTPPPASVKYDWNSIAEQLRKRPMDYALIFRQGPVAVVNALRQGNIAALHPDLGFEVRTANNQREAPRLCDLWVRYNPKKESDIRAAVRAAKQRGKN